MYCAELLQKEVKKIQHLDKTRTVKPVEDGLVVWFTGLPASGKTTISRIVAEKIRNSGYRVEVLDGDWARKTVSIGAGFTPEERWKHLVRIAWITRLLARNGVIVLCSFVSPYVAVRKEIREIVEEEARFLMVYVKCSIEEAIRRDSKGLYARALRGEIKHMTGIDDPYEEPEEPDLTLDTEKKSINENVNEVLTLLKKNGLDV